MEAWSQKQQHGAKYRDYDSLAEGEDSELLLWISNDPDLCLNPTQHRLGQGLSCHHDIHDTTKLHQITLIPWQVLNIKKG